MMIFDDILTQLFTKYLNSNDNRLLDIIYILNKNDIGIDTYVLWERNEVHNVRIVDKIFNCEHLHITRSNIRIRSCNVLSFYIKNYCDKVAKKLSLYEDEDWKIIYLLFVCTNYTELKEIDDRVPNAIDSHFKEESNLPNDLKFYEFILNNRCFEFFITPNYVNNIIELACLDKDEVHKKQFSSGLCLFSSKDVMIRNLESCNDRNKIFDLCMSEYNKSGPFTNNLNIELVMHRYTTH